jgi:hypothetical protein
MTHDEDERGENDEAMDKGREGVKSQPRKSNKKDRPKTLATRAPLTMSSCPASLEAPVLLLLSLPLSPLMLGAPSC